MERYGIDAALKEAAADSPFSFSHPEPMSLENFDDLLNVACNQPAAQRLLMVFAAKELPEDATTDQRAAFARGAAGVLAPVFYVDKLASELRDFRTLRAEAGSLGKGWDIVFIGAMDDRAGASAQAREGPAELERMLDDVKSGRIARYLAADHEGNFVRLQAG